MISFAVRYQPILRLLARHQPATVLDVGSGPEGLALFWPGAVVGVDLSFKRNPLPQPVCASVLALPFAPKSWPFVVCCDMLEHIPSAARKAAVLELARVTEHTLALAFPSGEVAQCCYDDIAHQLSPKRPAWLQEHLDFGLPDAGQIAAYLREAGWTVHLSWYEPVRLHYWLAILEANKLVQLFSYGLTRLAGLWLAHRLPVAQDGDMLRALLIATRPKLS